MLKNLEQDIIDHSHKHHIQDHPDVSKDLEYINEIRDIFDELPADDDAKLSDAVRKDIIKKLERLMAEILKENGIKFDINNLDDLNIDKLDVDELTRKELIELQELLHMLYGKGDVDVGRIKELLNDVKDDIKDEMDEKLEHGGDEA